ncbi:DUF1294 domain-containing protein [Feifania hominis]|uniref:DUF1294 domain-containing protein n=1 Tax=Feifania hominis TaxID=2763660 RepID=A0A926DDQ0_9FIRM|nr:DUF1294 domain-containing protein [Feifania hominis]MBC8537070.1 DUF1294 domain-containing protein [Feifania hominis]
MKDYLIWYLIVLNLLAFAVSAIDKFSSGRRQRRVSELALMLLAGFGGSVGLYLSMFLFRHKTKHPKFTMGVPLIMAAQAVVLYLLWARGVIR